MTSLQYSGLGGKRSSGYGRFELDIQKIPLELQIDWLRIIQIKWVKLIITKNSSDKTQKSSNSDDSNRASRTRRDTSAAASASSTVAVDAQKEVSSWSEFVAALQDSSIKEIPLKVIS